MSSKAVSIAVAVALALVVAALVITNRTPQASPASPTKHEAALNPALVSSITVARADGRQERVERSTAGEWSYIAGRVAWPAVLPDTVPAALAALPSELSKPASSPPDPGGPTITLGMRDGSALTLRLAPRSLGGRTIASMTGVAGSTDVIIENSVLDPFLNPGPAGWRIRDALPGARNCSRLMLDDGRSTLSLARIEGQWMVRRPVNARASHAAVSTLLGALADLRVLRFVESAGVPDPASMGLVRPALTITAETDERAADAQGGVRVRTIARELIVGGPADPKGDTRFASADADASIVMVLSSSAVSALSLAPRNYLHPIPASVSPGEVFMLTILDTTMTPGGAAAQRGYRREAGGWTEIAFDGTRRPAGSQPIEDLLEFLTSRPGEPEPIHGEDDMRTLRKIDLIDSEGDPREILSAGYTADGQFALRAGNVLFTYPQSAAPAILELPAFAGLPPASPAAPPTTLPADAPVWK